jgi:hypothetical protein
MLAMVKELNSFQGSRWNPGMAIARVGSETGLFKDLGHGVGMPITTPI